MPAKGHVGLGIIRVASTAYQDSWHRPSASVASALCACSTRGVPELVARQLLVEYGRAEVEQVAQPEGPGMSGV